MKTTLITVLVIISALKAEQYRYNAQVSADAMAQIAAQHKVTPQICHTDTLASNQTIAMNTPRR